ncbi:MAG: hypothetical protein JWN99_1750 [Ilumatobacteraceae bacterium]|nr:hypothetical protein [Ilumatobacteraceae bacterium]
MSSIIVSGSARRFVQPDRAVVALGLTVAAKDAPTALDQVSERSTVLAGVLAGLGIDPQNWVTDGVSVAEEYEWRKDTNVLVGHRATTGVTVTLDRPDGIAPLLREAVGTAQGQVRGITWQVDADNPAHRELLGQAARDARSRAEAYVQALDLSLGAVELISEEPIAASPPPGGPAQPMMRAMKASAPANDMAVSGGQIELVAEVHVRFAVL